MFCSNFMSVKSFSSCRDLYKLRLRVRNRHKLSSDTLEKLGSKSSAEIIKFLDNSNEYFHIKDRIPKYLLKKYKTPESIYLINEKTAKHIANEIGKELNTSTPLIEVNPGFCILTKEILKKYKGKMYLYETSSQFTSFIDTIKNEFPKRIDYKVADFFAMAKLAFQDKMDDGNRVQNLLGELSTNDNKRLVKIIGAMPSLSFLKHLMTTLIFHNTNNFLGRPDLFITIPGYHYEFLVDKKVKNYRHISIPALFQTLFDYRVITKVPSVHYLPWISLSEQKKASMIDEYCMYVVNITQKEKLPCKPEYLPLLWYFFKPYVISKKTRVIPMLEQWIPGCGVWLITGQDPPETNWDLAPGPDDAKLPHMTIFTQFGDLSLDQKITVFKRFISWPEFEQCPFRVTMENNLPRFITAIEKDEKDSIGTHIDDVDYSDLENETN